MNRLVVLALTAACTATLLSGCDNPVDTKANYVPLANSAVDVVGDVSGSCDCLKVGDVYRFTTLHLTSIDGDPDFLVIPVLNSLWKSDIQHYELNFFFTIQAVTPNDITFEVMNGARVGDTQKPCLMPSTKTTIRFPRKGCQLLDSDTGAINVYAGSAQHTKNCGYLTAAGAGVDHAIPIRGATLSGRMADDCSAVTEGVVSAGSFSKEALFRLCTCQTTVGQTSDVCTAPDKSYKDVSSNPVGACDGCGDGWQSLGGLLSAFAGDNGLKYGCTSDKGGPAVCLTAQFEGGKLDPAVWVPSLCPGF